MALTINHQTNDISATSGSVTIDGSAIASVSLAEQEFTATSGQTVFTVTGGITDANNVSVYLNGAKLFSTDVTISAAANTVTLATGATTGDLITVTEVAGAASGGGGASSFTGLSDTPASLGTAGQILQVNSGATALEFADASGGGGGFSKGTVTGNTIDLSTGNVFEYQPSANSTLTFSNAPTVHEFILKITGNSSGGGYDISSPTLIDQLDPSQVSNPTAFAFNNDGSKFFVGASGNIYEYSTNNYALAGATYVGSASVGQSETSIEDIFFVDGSNLQVVGTTTDTIHQYTIDNGNYDVSGGITYANKELVLTTSVHADLIAPRGFAYNSDGSKLFIVGSSSRDIFMVTLSTSYDPSSANSFVSTNRFDLNVNHFGETDPMAVRFNDDGSSIFIGGFTQDKVMEGSYSSGNEYSIDPNDITYNSATDIFNPSEITDIRAMVFVDGGVNMVLSQGNGSNLYRYRTAAPAYTITYPAAVKWDGGSAPPVPEKDKIDTYYFYTVDGGTTYYATQLGDNHA